MRESPTARARCPTLPGARKGVKAGPRNEPRDSSENSDMRTTPGRTDFIPGIPHRVRYHPVCPVAPPLTERHRGAVLLRGLCDEASLLPARGPRSRSTRSTTSSPSAAPRQRPSSPAASTPQRCALRSRVWTRSRSPRSRPPAGAWWNPRPGGPSTRCRASGLAAADAEAGSVLVGRGGRVSIATDQLNVQLSGDPSDSRDGRDPHRRGPGEGGRTAVRAPPVRGPRDVRATRWRRRSRCTTTPGSCSPSRRCSSTSPAGSPRPTPGTASSGSGATPARAAAPPAPT